jgi:hypothetical protein
MTALRRLTPADIERRYFNPEYFVEEARRTGRPYRLHPSDRATLVVLLNLSEGTRRYGKSQGLECKSSGTYGDLLRAEAAK